MANKQTHYDHLYDSGLYCMFSGDVLATCKCSACLLMRKGGLEPPSLAAPDPKSGTTPDSETSPQRGPLTSRHRASLFDTPTTTIVATNPVVAYPVAPLSVHGGRET